jgi:hypothetical protein
VEAHLEGQKEHRPQLLTQTTFGEKETGKTMITLSTSARLRGTAVAAAATCAGALAFSMLAGVAPAGAANPGENGRIAYTFDRDPASLALPADLKSINSDGSDVQTLSDTGKNYYPAYSPDGQYIAYVREDNGLSTLYRANADGSQPVVLMPGQNDAAYVDPTWSPDGKQIAYQYKNFSANNGTRWIIQIIDVDRGSTQIPETFSDPTKNSFSPAWSPLGDQIAYSLGTGQTDNTCPEVLIANIWVANVANPSQTKQLSSLGCFGDDPDWSPDGRYIAFTSDRGRVNQDIYRIDMQTEQVVQLTFNGFTDPAYSPDGQQLAAVTDRSGQPPAIYKMSAEGTNEQPLGQQGQYPTWQPLNPPPPPPPNGVGETELSVKALKAGKKLKVGDKYKLVKSAETNGEITKVKIVCKIEGKKYVNAKAKKPCGAKQKKKSDPTTAKVITKLKCDTRVKIKAVVTAQYQQTDPAKWKRTWKVKKNTGPNC